MGDTGPGRHRLTASRYLTQADRIDQMEEAPAKGEFMEIRFGESPFRQQMKSLEIHPPLRFKDVTEAERINNATSSITTSLGPGADPLREAQMGYDDIPVGMRPDTVVVRAKAKAAGPMQFKRCFRGLRALNPADKYETEVYSGMAEPSGYGFTRFHNFRPRRAGGEIDQSRPFLSTIRGAEAMGQHTSKRKDRLDPRVIDRPARKYYTAAKTLVVMPGAGGDDADTVVQTKGTEPETRVALATRMLKQHGANKTPYLQSSNTCANGANVYAWNEVFKFKDHKL